MPDDRIGRAAWWLLVVAPGLIGCPGPTAPVSIVPDSARGRWAIETALRAWESGHPPGVETTSPRVQVVDTRRKPGQSLGGFAILAESTDGRTRSFAVRLELLGPEERPLVRFQVVGIDPIVVFRQEDFDLLMHWEHGMGPAPDPAQAPPDPIAR